jgi:hypothetical protein
MSNYQEHSLDGASPVDLVVALYDGIIRFLYAAIAAVERNDVRGRRVAVKRALAILIHLQARSAHGYRRAAGAGAERVLRVDVCAHSAGLRGQLGGAFRRGDRFCPHHPRYLEAGSG